MKSVLKFARFSCIVSALLSPATGISMMNDQPRPQHTRTGKFHQHRNFHSRFLLNDRDILVYVPPTYHRTKQKHYPVFYLHDGQNLFDGATSFIYGKEWQVDETAQRLIRARAVEPLIIVGIYNTGIQRIDEYTPTYDRNRKMGGRADLYGQFLIEELKPFIDRHYRTLPEASNTGLGGSSLGGLVTLYLGLKHANVFGKLAVLSPSLWWDNRFILHEVEKLPTKPATRIWLDMGTHEGYGLHDVQHLRNLLVQKGWELDRDLRYFEAEGAVHDEKAWGERVAPLLKFLFPKA